MKTISAKFTVAELAKMMGKPAKEVLFLLQGIGVDVKSVESILDPMTAQAILSGKTQAPKSLIVRQTTVPPPAVTAKVKTERAALKRIRIVERSEAPAETADGEKPIPTSLDAVSEAGSDAPGRAGSDPSGAVEASVAVPPADAGGAATHDEAPIVRPDTASLEIAAPGRSAPTASAASIVPSSSTPSSEVMVPAASTATAMPAAFRPGGPGVDASGAAVFRPGGPGVGASGAAATMSAASSGAAATMSATTSSATGTPVHAESMAPIAAEGASRAVTGDGATGAGPVSELSESLPAAVSGATTVAAAPAVVRPELTREAGAAPASVTPTAGDRTRVPSAPHRPGLVAPPSARPAAAPLGARRGTPVGAPPRPVRPGLGAPISGRPPAPVAAPKQPAGPGGALGRILKRTGELPRPSAAPPPSPPVISANPTSPGITRSISPALPSPRPAAPPAANAAPRPVGAPVPGGPLPPRGAGGLGRAVIAPPTPSTLRATAPVTRSGPLQPRLGPPGRPGMGPPSGPPGQRPLGARGPMAPAAIPAGPPKDADKRRKDAGRPGAPKKDDVKKPASKKLRTKEVSALEEDVRDYLGTFKPDTYDDLPTQLAEGSEDDAQRPLSKSAQRRAAKKTAVTESGNVIEVKKAPTGPIFLSEGVTVKELSEKTGVLSRDLMKALLGRGKLATINQPVDPKLAIEIAREFGVEAAIVSFEEELELSRQQAALENVDKGATEAQPPMGERVTRAPVVTVMGHVDHGKTSLLDAIRQTNVAGGEAGGITQHIGAYRVEVKGRKIVFLDTPGHEAFTLMRARGAKATDIVVLVVAADDGVMPQTIEAIDHARAAKVPIVVAINKIDKPDANLMRVKQELAEKGVLVESFGGEVVSCEISAKKRIGIDALLEMILLQADLLELKAVTEGPSRGVVLEARREVGRGTLATVLVQQGTLRVGDVFFAGAAVGRVRAMLDELGGRTDEAGPATPVEVMGFDDLPAAGDTLQVVEDEGKARQVSSFRLLKEREESLAKSARMSLDSLFSRMKQGEAKDLALIVKADVGGSEEVLLSTLQKLSTDKVKISILHSGVGAISVNDVLLASASEAIVVGFNVRPEKKAQELADKEGVDLRLYSVIYTLTDEIKKAMAGLLDTVKKEVSRGRAEVRDTFRIPKVGLIAGCMVTEGVIPRSAGVRLVRDGRLIYEGKIASLKRFKDDASEVKTGFECGIGIAGYQDVKVGDVIEAYVVEEVAPSLA